MQINLSQRAADSLISRFRHLDPARSRLCHSQELHIPSGTSDCRRDPEGRPRLTRLGLEHWEEKAEDCERAARMKLSIILYPERLYNKENGLREFLGKHVHHTASEASVHTQFYFSLLLDLKIIA